MFLSFAVDLFMDEQRLLTLFAGAAIPLLMLAIVHFKKRKMDMMYNIKIAQTLGRAAAIRDHETGAHNFRVAYMASIIGEALGMKRKELQALMKGAFLHDVGKIGIADKILLKNGPLNAQEWEQMQLHPLLGKNLLEDMPWFNDALDVVFYHHERFDGNGYPDQLKGNGIPLNARIFAIIDVFDALLATRPYKKALSYDETIEIMKQNSGTHFDPKIFEKFLIYAPEFANITNTHSIKQLQNRLEIRRKKIFGL